MNGVSAPYYADEPEEEWDPFRVPSPHIVKYAAVRGKSIVMPWICVTCNDWTERGSYAREACTRCGTPRPINS